MQILLPQTVADAMAALQKRNINAWVIGGAVRDSLLQRPVHDWDLTVDCTPQQLADALPEAKPIGGQYGTVSWHGVEITPCRAEADYTDHRHPDLVTFGGGLRADLSRRDFTVNAMAWDGAVVTDPYHGRYDLVEKTLRCVGDPAQRFAEDALRILRLYRFAAQLNFAVEPATGAQALRLAPTLACVSAPRVRSELEKALVGPRPSALWPLVAADGLRPFGVWAAPEVLHGEQAAGGNPLLPLDEVPAVPLLRWWALARLCGCGLYQMETVLGLSKAFARDANRLDGLAAAGMPADRTALKHRLMDPPPADEEAVVLTLAAVEPAFEELPGLYAGLQASGEPYRKEQLRITPAELLTEGVPAKKIGAVQRCLLQAVIDTPELNVWPTLAQMAKGLKKLV